jgi:MFS family permease
VVLLELLTVAGVELLFVIVGTLSIAQASTGFNSAMRIEGWIYFWRVVLGFGIGAEYPVTAIIAAEVRNPTACSLIPTPIVWYQLAKVAV